MDQKLNWYAVCTKSRCEKSLVSKLNEKGIEAWIPLQRTLKQWSDRKKRVEEVMIRSYIFVHIQPQQYDEVLKNPGAVRFIWFNGEPAVIPDSQIEILKLISDSDVKVTTVASRLAPGTPVKIIAGPLEGLTGELVNSCGKYHVVIRIDHVYSALSLTISPQFLEKIGAEKKR